MRAQEGGHSPRFRSLLLRYFLIAAAFILIPVSIITAVYYVYYNRLLTGELESYNRTTAFKLRDMTDTVFGETQQMLTQICMNDELQLLLGYNAKLFPNYDAISRYASIYNSFYSRTLTSQYIIAVSAYSISNDYVFSTIGSQERRYYKDSGWIDTALTYSDELFHAERRQRESGEEVVSCFSCFPLSRTVKRGIVCIDLDAACLHELLGTVNDSYYERVMVVNGRGQVVIGSFEDDEAFYMAAQQAEMKGKQTATMDFNGIRYLFTRLPSQETGLVYLFATPLDVYKGKLHELMLFMCFAFLGCLLLSLALAFIIARTVYKPIRNIRLMLDAGSSLPDEYRASRRDEYNYIVESLRGSLRRTEDISRELQLRLELLDKAKTAALQAHINPHFLCNTLETINFTALRALGGENEISEMVVSLSALLRQSLETENVFTTLADEIAHAKEYIHIQQIRYCNRFDVEWEIEEECLPCRVIKIMLQPLLENAIYHGVKPLSSRRGRILVCARAAQDSFEVRVTDNGRGMPPDEMERLNSGLQDEYIQRNRHIGLMNVNQRLKLLFGESYGLRLSAAPQEGLSVSILLPRILSPEEEWEAGRL